MPFYLYLEAKAKLIKDLPHPTPTPQPPSKSGASASFWLAWDLRGSVYGLCWSPGPHGLPSNQQVWDLIYSGSFPFQERIKEPYGHTAIL